MGVFSSDDISHDSNLRQVDDCIDRVSVIQSLIGSDVETDGSIDHAAPVLPCVASTLLSFVRY